MSTITTENNLKRQPVSDERGSRVTCELAGEPAMRNQGSPPSFRTFFFEHHEFHSQSTACLLPNNDPPQSFSSHHLCIHFAFA